MRSHAKNSRRSRGRKGPDEDYYAAAHGDDMRPETYPHVQEMPHRNEGYRPSSASTRSSYDTNREVSNSRNQRSEAWRRSDLDDTYITNDDYHHLSRGRGDHEILMPRESEWSGRAQAEYRYPSSRGDWHEHNYISSSYAESSSRSTPSALPRQSRTTSSYDPWVAEESPPDHRRALDVVDDRSVDRGSYDWGREHHRDKKGQKFQSDSGWDTHRRQRGWDAPTTWRDPSHSKDNVDLTDRSWEPAPSWRPSGRSDHGQGHRNGQRTGNTDRASSSTMSKSGKRVLHHNKAKRDWRTDDGTLNNWTRRTTHDTSGRVVSSPDRTLKTPSRRKHYRSPSRSGSPAGSNYSHRSWNRSRSPSPLPKRRRREATPPLVSRSRTPSDRGRKAWVSHSHEKESSISPKRSPASHSGLTPSWSGYSHQPRRWSLSPRRSPESAAGRGRSVSSTSSRSSKRSISQSPPNRVRAVHRLPMTEAVASTSPTSPLLTSRPRESGARKNGRHHQLNGQQANGHRRKSAPGGSMPPPSLIPVAHVALTPSSSRDNPPPVPAWPVEERPSRAFLEARSDSTNPPARFNPIRHMSFKPITQTSSSLKKFFPTDEDDMDLASDDPQFAAPREMGDPAQFSSPLPERKRIRTPPPQRDGLEGKGGRLPFSATKEAVPSIGHDQTLAINEIQHLKSSVKEPVPDRDHYELVSTPSLDVQGELYSIVSQVGEGTFGKVYKAQNTMTRVYVALKRIRMEAEKDGFPVTAMREIKLLQSLQHQNVVRLYEMMISNGSIYMVFEYMDHDLTGILSQTQFNFTDAHLKSLCHQMLAGLAYLHHKGVIHRDIKGSNILINNRGELKLADFGLARFYQKRRRTDYTNRVITLWYRPPELLFGATVYGPEVDMWSAGCIMLELFTKKPVFQGIDEIHQLDVVYKIIGTPTPERWAGVMDLPWYELIKPKEAIPNHFRDLFRKWMSPAALDLAEHLLAYNPLERATAVQAMDAPYFTQEQPKAALPVGLATVEGEWHELETKRERAKRRKKPENAA